MLYFILNERAVSFLHMCKRMISLLRAMIFGLKKVEWTNKNARKTTATRQTISNVVLFRAMELLKRHDIIGLFVVGTILTLSLLKHPVNKVYSLNLLAVNDFCINLGRADIGMPHQLAGRIEICAHGHHQCSECVT